MARVATVQKQQKQSRKVIKMREKRAHWNAVVKAPDSTPEERLHAFKMLAKTRAASKVREVRRCRYEGEGKQANGRGKGVYRRVGLCRNVLRKLVMNGNLPGFVKASW